MIEILLTVYIASMAGSFLLLAWHYTTTKRQLQAPALENLNKNLKPLGLFWSHSNGSFSSLHEGSVAEDRRRSLRNILWLSLLAFASLPGFVLLSAVIFSVRYFARSRVETAVFNSPLALSVNLPEAETAGFVEQMKSTYGIR